MKSRSQDGLMDYYGFGLGVWITFLNLYDVYVTKIILDSGGKEANILMCGVVENTVATIFVKLAIMSVFFMLCYVANKRGSKFVLPVMTAALIFYGFVAVWNTIVYWRL